MLTRQADIVYRDQHVTAFICSHFFKRNAGHSLVIPNAHYESIYSLPQELGARISVVTKSVALGLKTAFNCDGVTVWQTNEPAGGQTVWHYHVHVIPRFTDDRYYENLAISDTTYTVMEPEQRAALAVRLRRELERM